MKASKWRLLAALLILASVQSAGFAQLWAPTLAPSRAYDWQHMVYQPPDTSGWTQCGATINPPASAAIVQSAINNCGGATDAGNKFVRLAAGQFNLTGGITINKSNFKLVGAGANLTEIVDSTGSGCGLGPSVVCVIAGNPGNFYTDYPGTGHAGSGNTTPGVSGFTQGSTQITVQDASQINVGDGIVVRQLDGGNLFSQLTRWLTCSSGFELGVCGADPTGTTAQPVVVTAKTNNTITFTPPLYFNGWSNSNSPSVWYFFNTLPAVQHWLVNVGVEDLKISRQWLAFENGGPASYGSLQFVRVNGGWAKGVTINQCDNGCMLAEYAINIAWFNNYIFQNTGATTNNVSVMYGFYSDHTANLSIYNNIIQQIQAPVLFNSNVHGSVIAYNITRDQPTNHAQDLGWQWYALWPEHGVGINAVLVEGEDGEGAAIEMNHGTGCCFTFLRNYYTGREPDNGFTTIQFTEVLNLSMISARFSNVVGNVFGTAGYHINYEISQSFGGSQDPNIQDRSIYNIGYQGQIQNLNYDPMVATSLLRWGNFDTVTGNTRWCGQAGNTRFSTAFPAGCGGHSEIPADNVVPATETVPASFFLASKPAWFGAVPFPPIGPEIASGNAVDASGQPQTHANKIPARLCYEGLGGAADGTGAILPFNANSCYGSVVTTVLSPSKPSGLALK